MSEYGKFYNESRYPFQDGILAIVKSINAPFYLTDGTALSRHYFPVRYSDDLDLFVNAHAEFIESLLLGKFKNIKIADYPTMLFEYEETVPNSYEGRTVDHKPKNVVLSVNCVEISWV